MMQNTACFVLMLPWSVCMPGTYLALQLDEYFHNVSCLFLSSHIIAPHQRRCLSARWTQAAP